MCRGGIYCGNSWARETTEGKDSRSRWRWSGKSQASLALRKVVWAVSLGQDVIYATASGQQTELLNPEPRALCLWDNSLPLLHFVPETSHLPEKARRQKALYEEKKSNRVSCIFLIPFTTTACFQHPCVLPSGRSGVDGESVREDGDLQTVLLGA